MLAERRAAWQPDGAASASAEHPQHALLKVDEDEGGSFVGTVAVMRRLLYAGNLR
jgi:hypothetical protein